MSPFFMSYYKLFSGRCGGDHLHQVLPQTSSDYEVILGHQTGLMVRSCATSESV
jgi:hypothetical protein